MALVIIAKPGGGNASVSVFAAPAASHGNGNGKGKNNNTPAAPTDGTGVEQGIRLGASMGMK